MPPAVQIPHQPVPDGVTPPGRRAPVRRTLWVAAVTAAVAMLGACGDAGSTTGAAAGPTPSATSTSGSQGGGGQGVGPGQGGTGPGRRDDGLSGASGLLAALDGKTLQVQGNQTQTAVTWSASTAFTQTKRTTAAAVKVGSCVVIRAGAPPVAQGTPSAGQPGTGQPAVSVTVSAAVGGQCTAVGGRGGFGAGGFGRGGGFRGGPRQGTAPSGTPTDRPTGMPTRRPYGRVFGAGGGGAFGRVTAVTGRSITVASTRPSANGGTATTTAVTVPTTAATTYTTTARATSSALKVGTCVTAFGRADDTGSIAARSISVRPAESGTCTGGFGRPAGPGGAVGGNAPGGGAGA